MAPLKIPVLDLNDVRDPSPDALAPWREAVTDVGCFALRHHGVQPDVLAACLAAAEDFYACDKSYAQRWAMQRSLGNRGYVPEDLRPVGAHTRRLVRDYASFDIGPELYKDPASLESILLGSNLWPELPGFAEAVGDYYQAVQFCAESVSQMFSRLCGLAPNHIAERSTQGCSLLRLLHYPVPALDLDEVPNGHTDYEWFTLIWQSAAGLEVLGRDGRTRVLDAPQGTFVVLIGDLLEVLSDGVIESTLHWVRPRERDRFSLTYFYGPDFHEEIVPMSPTGTLSTSGTYPALRTGDHLTALRVRHLKHLRQAYDEGTLTLPFALPEVNPLKAAKVRRLERGQGAGDRRSGRDRMTTVENGVPHGS
ncbi:2OG-Fe(II) oxygenase family protein [Streptomyces xanthochromogenes]|uniref:2OG-Fe(II) oxygenase family protein n=1 Tax=Streptomyces xanthochromogenes TaxID=67384 RepID=UPI003444F6E5